MLADTPTGESEERARAADVLAPGIATGIGSLPHRDAAAAASLVLRVTPDLPAVPQLPMRSPREQMIVQWLDQLPEVEVTSDGTARLVGSVDLSAPLTLDLGTEAHAGWNAFMRIAPRARSVPRVKLQVTGPLTLGAALVALGADVMAAYGRAAQLVTASVDAMLSELSVSLDDAEPVVFLDEPGLVAWRHGDGPMHADEAVDRLSAVLARISGITGVHVCSGGDVGIACGAGPTIVGVDIDDPLSDFALPLGRHVEGDGWVAWGAVPTQRPVGESAEPLWRALVEQWCELTRRGCDPYALRSHALLTPTCGLAGHGLTQAERALHLAGQIGRRVGDQAAATRLTIGA